MRTNRCHLDSSLAEVRTVFSERPRPPYEVPGQQARCPLCRGPLVVRQGPAGPRWQCSCRALQLLSGEGGQP